MLVPTTSLALPFRLDAMRLEDIPTIMAVERRVFSLAWTSGIYRRELTANPWSHYRVLRSSVPTLPPLLAYGGIWQMGETAHIPTIATHPDFTGRQLGSYLLFDLLLLSVHLGCTEITLEVRASNERAQALYLRHGFENVGTRRRYYSDNNENAILMTRYDLLETQIRSELTAIEAQVQDIWAVTANR